MGAFHFPSGTPPLTKSSRFSFQVSQTPGVSLAAVAKALLVSGTPRRVGVVIAGQFAATKLFHAQSS